MSVRIEEVNVIIKWSSDLVVFEVVGLEVRVERGLHLLALVLLLLAIQPAPHFEPDVFLLIDYSDPVDASLR